MNSKIALSKWFSTKESVVIAKYSNTIALYLAVVAGIDAENPQHTAISGKLTVPFYYIVLILIILCDYELKLEQESALCSIDYHLELWHSNSCCARVHDRNPFWDSGKPIIIRLQVLIIDACKG